MSDEFNMPNRRFKPGDDHMWTSVEKPDGVNGALQLYSHNMTSTKCDKDGTCYFNIETVNEESVIHVYNMYKHPPGYVDVPFYYRAGMVQSWNKFCYQGGMLEVRVQLPGAVTKESGNPDLAKGNSGKVTARKYYPTWPGIWMLGNLGRAIFSASTNRMWPFSYDACEPDLFDPTFQRISACNDNPGYGLNPNQGRGAPEIDVLEGSADLISSSIQLGPGMPDEYRLMGLDKSRDHFSCIYTSVCQTPGGNFVGVPTAVYNARGYKTWYQGLRYAANNFCAPDPKQKQDYEAIAASLKDGITANVCSVDVCPASNDTYGDLGPIDGKGTTRWGINYNGTCYSKWNVYTGTYLCDPDNTFYKCPNARPENATKSNVMAPFHYQMDAVSTNWQTHVGVYTEFVVYQVEWVTGKNGYTRWMLHGAPLYEIPSESILNVPQNSKKTNPQKIMVEEPLYIIMNVALSQVWGAAPPNPGIDCRGNGTVEEINRICDSFPMHMKVDYVRLYQDLADDLDADNYMQVGCDPKSHPTKKWIEGHIDEYEDSNNKIVEVSGKAFCETSDDCTIGVTFGKTALMTGKCVKKRCECLHNSWGGPRCTTAISGSTTLSGGLMKSTYGPPLGAACAVAVVICLLLAISSYMVIVKSAKESKMAMAAVGAKRKAASGTASTREIGNRGSQLAMMSKDGQSPNFV
ncbi:unnamed protein product [Peronospora farinosa]|uniref:Beta-glucan synthesis-associated protein n=1 Tax=Peronospora farinosa TaxID=134698 RepID=A0AAV0TMX9_9STRA|nr:unnamed protein product [Peronospora farinosa]CAI5724625.1 unnamed protein product [Peronospora farinosa]